ncbi:MAG: ATP-dependent DNA helicase RecG [Spirochaetaceae bacterium]|jgi:ATP-dependent DNA helicase RecG|nr:ATP-dependent DNA helicase RecG [Spirochaetaceae bacterium]
MFLRELTAAIDHLRGAGPKSSHTLARLGITSVADLLCHYPRDWEDRSRKIPLADYAKFPAVCTVVRVLAHDWFGFGRKKTLKVHVEDQSARAVLVCFNRPFMEKQLIVGNYYFLWGRFSYKYGDLQSTEFEIEAPEEATAGPGEPAGWPQNRNFGRILPVYPLSAGITQGLLRRLIAVALDQYAAPLEDELPPGIIAREGFLPKAQAIRAIHFPDSPRELELARKTLIYEELFYLEVLVGKRARERRTGAEVRRREAEGLRVTGEFSPLQQRLLDRLPFPLTPGQREVIAEINRDMSGPFPMGRLLQGDVGSGKTLVSFLAALAVVEAGGQAALLAPTELLARQHAENAGALLEPLGVRPAFLTGNLRAAGRSHLLKALAAGEIDLVIGTHALFSRDVLYKKLRLVVVDEQHRFGVIQRSQIMAKGTSSSSPGTPDLLMMSATPIPRTLALTVFGDLEVSVIRDLPPGRQPVKTHLARESNEERVYDFVRKELAAGRQAYFVYPLIEVNEKRDLKDAVSMAERLGREVFPEYPTALLHSRLDEEEKRRIMDGFRRGNIRVLAATSVVEVGVDVPNAACMVVEHAERFGLSALHQLRGRVGRGPEQAYCFLVYSDELTEDGKTRLKVMLENADGFVIAEEDLKLRGPGQIAGLEQSGYLSLGVADPLRDAAELERARHDAFTLLEEDPGLLHPDHLRVAAVLDRASPFSKVVW